MGLFGPPNVPILGSKHDVKGLIKALRYRKDSRVRSDAAWYLREVGDARAIEPLIVALSDSDRRVRSSAARSLGQFGDACAIEPLIAALTDSDWDVRENAARALGQIGDARAVDPLLARLKDGNDYARKEAADALGQIGDARAVEPLLARLKDGDDGERRDAADALGQIGDARALDPLLAALRDRDCLVQCAAADALARFGTTAFDPLIATLKAPEGRGYAARALGEMGDTRAVEPLVAVLKDTAFAADALEKLGWQPTNDENGAYYWVAKRAWDKCVEIGKPAVKPLIEQLGHPDLSKARDAAVALDKIGWRPGPDANGAAYREAKQRWAKVVGGSGPYWQE